ncbi:hypothetical protein C0991_001400, partial [Blastosporella zonata]
MLLRKSNPLAPFAFPNSVSNRVTVLQDFLATPRALSSDIQNSIYDLLTHIWTQTWIKPFNLPTGDPTIISLALSMLQDDGSFKHPKYTTGPIAQLEYCIRSLFVMYLHTQVSTHNSTYTKETDALEQWFTEKHDSTLNSLYSLQHRASSIATVTMALPQIWWLDRQNFDSLLYQGETIHFKDIRNMLVILEEQLLQCYKQDILFSTDLYISYGQLRDDLTNTAVGYSFIADPKNPFVSKRDQLMEHILASPILRSKIIAAETPGGHIHWNKFILRQWLHQYAKFHGLLLARAHMLGGSPGRGTEITAMTFANIPTSTHRNCVVFGKYLAMLVTYHKGTAMTGMEKLIPHAFDGITSDLIIQDLAIARPFAELAAYICYPDQPDIGQVYREHLFVNNGKLFTSDEVSAIMISLSEPVVGARLGLRSWRQVSIAFKRKRCTKLQDLIDVDEEETVDALQATHSRQTENRIYGLSPDALSGVAEDVLPLYLDASTEWQIQAMAVPGGLGLPYTECVSTNFSALVKAGHIKQPSRGNPNGPIAITTADLEQLGHNVTEEESDTTLFSIDDPVDLPRTYMFYCFYDPEMLTSLSASSTLDWSHQDTDEDDDVEIIAPSTTSNLDQQYTNQDDDVQIISPPTSPSSYQQHAEMHKEEFTLSSDDDPSSDQQEETPLEAMEQEALHGLRQILGNNTADWSCPEQKDAVLATLQGNSDVCAILRTGCGKTMLALIPSLLENKGATVVILPLKSLVSDYIRKLRKMNIAFEHYTGKDTNIVTGNRGLIIVSADQAMTDPWKQTIGKIYHGGVGVNRLVFDEAHLALTDEDYRATLKNIRQIRIIPVPIIVLSATIPPTSETALATAFGLTDDRITIRMSTDRPELCYTIQQASSNHNETVQSTVDVVLKETKLFTAKDRALVFVSLKEEEGHPIANALDCDFYEGGKHLSDTDRERMYHQWIDGTNKVM